MAVSVVVWLRFRAWIIPSIKFWDSWNRSFPRAAQNFMKPRQHIPATLFSLLVIVNRHHDARKYLVVLGDEFWRTKTEKSGMEIFIYLFVYLCLGLSSLGFVSSLYRFLFLFLFLLIIMILAACCQRQSLITLFAHHFGHKQASKLLREGRCHQTLDTTNENEKNRGMWWLLASMSYL